LVDVADQIDCQKRRRTTGCWQSRSDDAHIGSQNRIFTAGSQGWISEKFDRYAAPYSAAMLASIELGPDRVSLDREARSG